MRRRTLNSLLLLTGLLILACAFCASASAAESFENDGGASWQLAQPDPPPAPPGATEAPGVIGLGRIGDIEFAPGMANRGALITSGNPPTIPAGVWEYNGVGWHELATVCGASDGGIIWAGSEEFWTISDGRPGGADNALGQPPPLRDNTLCRFSNPNHKGEPLRVMESFAFPAFEADSYQAMNAGVCLSPNDCWFAGNPLPAGSVQAGSFHLHWNGEALLEVPYLEEGFAVESMQAYEQRIFESVRFRLSDRDEASGEPSPLHTIQPDEPESPFQAIPAESLPLYAPGEQPAALDFLHLSAGAEELWAAAGPPSSPPSGAPGQVTIARNSGGVWQQLIGPLTTEPAANPFAEETPVSIAAEPGSESAWIGLDSPSDYASATSEVLETLANSRAKVARIGANGAVSDDGEELPSAASGIGPKGAAFTITCPAAHDCWMATTRGWLFHLSTAEEQAQIAAGLTRDSDPAFETLISERPADQGLPVTTPDSVPPDTSGLLGELTATPMKLEVRTEPEAERVEVALVSRVHTRLVHGTTLELRFHLAVKARLKLLARRSHRVVASTPMRTLKAGDRSLQLRLDPKRWPTSLQLQSHPLAKLPTVTVSRGNETTVSTSLRFPNLRLARLPDLFP